MPNYLDSSINLSFIWEEQLQLLWLISLKSFFLSLYPTQFNLLSIFNTISRWKHTWKKKRDWSNFQILAAIFKISQTCTETKQFCTAFTWSHNLFQLRMPLFHIQTHAFASEFDNRIFLCFVSIYEWLVHTGYLKFLSSFFHCHQSAYSWMAATCAGWPWVLVSSICIQNLPSTFKCSRGDKEDYLRVALEFCSTKLKSKHILKKTKMTLDGKNANLG